MTQGKDRKSDSEQILPVMKGHKKEKIICLKCKKDIDCRIGYYNVGSTIVCLDCMSNTGIDDWVFQKALENENLSSGVSACDP